MCVCPQMHHSKEVLHLIVNPTGNKKIRSKFLLWSTTFIHSIGPSPLKIKSLSPKYLWFICFIDMVISPRWKIHSQFPKIEDISLSLTLVSMPAATSIFMHSMISKIILSTMAQLITSPAASSWRWPQVKLTIRSNLCTQTQIQDKKSMKISTYWE